MIAVGRAADAGEVPAAVLTADVAAINDAMKSVPRLVIETIK